MEKALEEFFNTRANMTSADGSNSVKEEKNIDKVVEDMKKIINDFPKPVCGNFTVTGPSNTGKKSYS